MNPVWKWAVIKPLNGLRSSNEFKHEHLKPELSASPDRTMQKHAWNHNTCRLRRSEAAWSVLCALCVFLQWFHPHVWFLPSNTTAADTFLPAGELFGS